VSELLRRTRSTSSLSSAIAFLGVQGRLPAGWVRISDLETAPDGRVGDFGVCLAEGNEGLGVSVVCPRRGGRRRGRRG